MAKKATGSKSAKRTKTAGTSAAKGKPKVAAKKAASSSNAPKKAARAKAKPARAAARSGGGGRGPDHGARIREQVREMTASALHGKAPSASRVGDVFREVMHGTIEAVDRAMPPAFRSDKLREAVEGISKQFERLAHDARSAGESAMEPVMDAAAKAARAARDRPTEAVQESMRTGVRAAAGAASRLMSATGGMLSGVADGIEEATKERR